MEPAKVLLDSCVWNGVRDELRSGAIVTAKTFRIRIRAPENGNGQS
jgi:hypothetical protein